jgi:DNA-binding NtrC family response regulator
MNDDLIKLLVVEDEEFDVRRIKNTLHLFDKQIHIEDIVSTGKDALSFIRRNPSKYDVVILDYQISGGLYGEELIKKIKILDDTLQIIVITKMTLYQTDLYFANQLIESGSFWFGTKYPTDIDEFIYQPTDFLLAIMNAYEKRKMELERQRSRKKLDRSIQSILDKQPLIGKSNIMKQLSDLVKKYSVINATVLITGESGTGKELVARDIHYHGPRKYERFVTVNCASIPSELIESELFGFEKGAFTGAFTGKPGLFEQANGGTIFLDEIGELPPMTQTKLLRVLEDGELDKIGRKQSCKVNVRVIAATNKNLANLVQGKKFREELFYRLNILNIEVPPLRDRNGDVELLINFFMKYYSNDLSIKPPILNEESSRFLSNYQWPGNIRQLKNVVQRIVLSGNDLIDVETVKKCISMPSCNAATEFVSQFPSTNILPLKKAEIEFRKHYLKHVRQLSRTDTEAAEKLGLAPPNYFRVCKEVGLK